MLHEGRREKRPICLAEDRDTSFSLSLPFPLSTPFRIFETGPIPFPRTVPQTQLEAYTYDIRAGRGSPKIDESNKISCFLNVTRGRVSTPKKCCGPHKCMSPTHVVTTFCQFFTESGATSRTYKEATNIEAI